MLGVWHMPKTNPMDQNTLDFHLLIHCDRNDISKYMAVFIGQQNSRNNCQQHTNYVQLWEMKLG